MFPKIPESETAHFEKIRQQEEQELRKLVNSYGGIMIGHPSEQDIVNMARWKAIEALGLALSNAQNKAADKLAHKFRGSFC